MKKLCFARLNTVILIMIMVTVFALLAPAADAISSSEQQEKIYSKIASDYIYAPDGSICRYRYTLNLTNELATARIEMSECADGGFGQLFCILETRIYLSDYDVYVTQTDVTNNWWQSRGRVSNEVEYEGKLVTGEIVSATATFFISGSLAGTLTVGTNK